MAHLSINVLGPLQVSIDEAPITTLESVKARALLAYLVVEAERAHTRESLVGLLWPDYAEESARHNLRQALFNLRVRLGDHSVDPPYLLVTRESIQFNRASDYSLDLEAFNDYFFTCVERLPRCIDDCSAHASNLEQMVKLYHGEFLQQFTLDDSAEFEEWVLVQRESLHQRILEAHSYLTNYYELHSDFPSAQRHAANQLALDPWREEAHRDLMKVLALDGQRSAALAQYETCKRVLAEELDVEPSMETRELYEQIRLDTLCLKTVPTAYTRSAPINNLPVQLTHFIGRERELKYLNQLIEDPECRCITLIGPGGIGKTRLAIQIASNNLNQFTHGSAFVNLASVGSMSGVIPTLANAVEFAFQGLGNPKDHLLTYLHEKQILLIFDNVEHLLLEGPGQESIVQMIIEVLQQAPQVKLLVTSREALGIQEEYVFEVPGLAFPATTSVDGFTKFDAVTLFEQRARRASPGFEFNDASRADVVRILQLVEGMPLAIELAATWMRILSPAEIAEEIEDSLDFLSATVRDLPERHRSMRVVFDHSWQMLSPDEQDVLSKLSLFRGGFQRQAAEQVAGASLTILSTLVNRSLIRRIAPGRYDLHELIRQYSAAHLAANTEAYKDAQEQHYDFFLNLAQSAAQELKGRDQLVWLGRLDQEHDNLRLALEWALANQGLPPRENELALRLAGSLRWFWRMQGHFQEGYDWLMEALRRCPENRTKVQGIALMGISLLGNALGDLGSAYGPAEQSVDIFRELAEQDCLAEALVIEGLSLIWQGQSSLCHERTREALMLYRKVGDRWGEAHALYRLGSYLADYGGDPDGRAMLEESAAILEELGEKYLYTSVLISLGIVDLSLGEYTKALPRLERGLVSAREIRHPWGIADALTNLGCLYRIRGEYALAQSRFEEAVHVYHEHMSNIWETDVHCAMTENAIAQGDFEYARDHLKTASTILGSSNNEWLHLLVSYFTGLLAYYEGDIEKASKLLSETTEHSRAGQFRPDLARSLVTLGLVKLKQGEFVTAVGLVRESLSLYQKLGHKLGTVIALEALAEVSMIQDDFPYAVKLYAMAGNAREALGAPIPPVNRPGYSIAISTCRNQLGEAAFSNLWDRIAAWSFEEVLEEISKIDGAD